jgi:hypothetical protein
VVVHQGFFGFGLWDFGRSHLNTLCTIFHFRAFLGVIEPTNVAFRVYPFVHFYFRLVNFSRQRVLATPSPFALLAKVAYRITSQALVCYRAELGWFAVSSISWRRQLVRVQFEAAALLALYRPR